MTPEVPLSTLSHDEFFHVRIIVGMVTGLSITRLLAGLARLIQSNGSISGYSLYVGWATFILLAVVHFWWFEFGLAKVHVWTFAHYLFLIFYAALFYFISAVLFPDATSGIANAQQFHARQRWFYALLALLFLADMVDSALKGEQHFRSFGPLYPVRQAVLAALSILAAFVQRRALHFVFLAFVLLIQVYWIVAQFGTMD